MLALEVADDGCVELVAAHLDGGGLHLLAQGGDQHVGGAGTDVQDHGALGREDVDARADGGGHGLLNEVGVPGAGAFAGLDDGPLLHLGGLAGHGDDGPGLEEDAAAHHLLEEGGEHALRGVQVGDDPVLQGPEDQLIVRGPAQHLLGLLAQGGHLAGAALHGHHGGLPEDDALAPHVDEGIGGAQIHPDIGGGEQTHSASFQGT